jgi:hypothetical protein
LKNIFQLERIIKLEMTLKIKLKKNKENKLQINIAMKSKILKNSLNSKSKNNLKYLTLVLNMDLV